MKRKKSFDSYCMCCTLLSQFASPPCMCVCVYLHQSPTITQQSFLSQLYHSVSASTLPPPQTPLPPVLILRVSLCSPAIPPIQSILLHHASARLKKWQSIPSSQEHGALCCTSFIPVTHRRVVLGTPDWKRQQIVLRDIS